MRADEVAALEAAQMLKVDGGVTFGALRTEIDAALAKVNPQIRGMFILSSMPELEQETYAAIDTELADHRRRRDLLTAMLMALDTVDTVWDALIADGYPEMPLAGVSQAIMEDIQDDLAAVAAAVAEFEVARAEVLTISLGTPADKPA
jgi:hypothetical protein